MFDKKKEEEEVCENCKKLEIQIEELNDKLKRVLADYQNLKRRTAEEKTELSFISNLSILGSLLDVSDDFDLAIEKYTKTETDEAEWLTGINMVRNKMGSLLKNQLVTEIECSIDDDFNPDYHEALNTTIVKEKELDGAIVGVVRKGYMLGDKILRPVRVIVGKYEKI